MEKLRKISKTYCLRQIVACLMVYCILLGIPGQVAAKDGDPFSRPTDLAVTSTGELFVSDGYSNARVHKYSPDGELLLSWGERGSGPGQFNLPHCVRVDRTKEGLLISSCMT